jgi:hypothetical protein
MSEERKKKKLATFDVEDNMRNTLSQIDTIRALNG